MVTQVGSIVAVKPVVISASLDVDVAAGATVLVVDDLSVFSTAGGSVTLSDDDAFVTVVYSGLTDDGDVQLASPLAAGWLASTLLTPSPVVTGTAAVVELGDDDAGTVDAWVPAQVAVHPSLASFDGPLDVPVLAHVADGGPLGYAFTVAELVGVPSTIDGAAVDPETTIPPAALTDGLPPVNAPAGVIAEPRSVGGVQVSWDRLDPVVDPDPITYRVHASLTSPVPEDGSALVSTTPSDSESVTTVAGVPIPLAVATTVYLKVQSSDADGLGPFSAEVSATTRIGDDSVSPFFRIEARQILAGELEADSLKVVNDFLIGDYVVEDGRTSTRTYYEDVNHTIPGTTIGPFRQIWRGLFDAVEGAVRKLKITGPSSIEAGGSVTMRSGVTDPSETADLAPSLATVAWPAVPSGYKVRGISWDATDGWWLRLLVPTSGDIAGRCRVEQIPTTWSPTSTTPIPFVTLGNVTGIGEDDFNSVARIGASYYVAVSDLAGAAPWYIAKFAASNGAFQVLSTNNVTGVEGRAGVLVDGNGSPVLVHVYRNGSTRRLRGFTMYPADLTPFFNGDIAAGEWAGSAQIMGGIGVVGSTLFGYTSALSQWAIISNTTVYAFDQAFGGSFTRYAAHDITLEGDTSRGGAAFRPGAGNGWHSYVEGGTLGRYSTYRQTTSGEGGFVAYTNHDGTYTTKRSPLNVAVVPNHRFLAVVLPKAPSLAPQSRVYAYVGTAPPASDTSLKQRPETITARTLLIDLAVAGGAGTPPAANTYPAGSPGEIVSQSGLTRIGGDDIVIVPTPTAPTRAANKGYVDALLTDTGWTDLTYASGYSAGTPGQLAYRIKNGIVYIRGGATGTLSAGTFVAVNSSGTGGVLPVAARPEATMHNGVYGTGLRSGSVEVRTDGRIYLGANNGVAAGSMTWCAADICYPVAV